MNWQVYTAKDGSSQVPVRVVTLHHPASKDGEYPYMPDIRVRLADGSYLQFSFDAVPNPTSPQQWHVYHYVDEENRREIALEMIYNGTGATKQTWDSAEQESIAPR